MRCSRRSSGPATLEPTPVQAGIIPRALAGVDVLGQARTGTGKTAAFAIPILEQIKHGGKSASARRRSCWCRRASWPCRSATNSRSSPTAARSACVPIYGGKPIRGQIDKLQRGADVVIGTPGRVLDLIGRGALDLRTIQIVVLDEADRMLDIGFRPDIEKILRRCPKERQTLLLERHGRRRRSSGWPARTCATRRCMNFSPKNMAVETIEQFYFTVDHERKFDLLVRAAEARQARAGDRLLPHQARAPRRFSAGCRSSFPGADMMHGDMVQGARDRVMKAFRAGEVQILVATDVVGRGIDVTSISHIINYDIPQSSRRLRPPRRPHRPHGPRGRRLHVRHDRRRRRADADRNAHQSAAEARRDRRLQRRGDGGASSRCAPRPQRRTVDEGDEPAEPQEPQPPRPTPPGRRPPKRHRKGL